MSVEGSPDLFAALKLSYQAADRWLKDGYIDIPELDPELVELREAFVPVTQIEGWKSASVPLIGKAENEQFLGWKFDSGKVNEPLRLVSQNSRAFDLFVDRTQANIVLGYSLDSAQTAFAHEVLGGKLKRPTPRGNRPPTIERNTLLISVIERVNYLYGIPRASDEQLWSDDGKLLVYGCSIAWAAFEIAGIKPYGRELSPEQVAKIVRNDKDARSLARENPYLYLPEIKAPSIGEGLLAAQIASLPPEVEEVLSRAVASFSTP